MELKGVPINISSEEGSSIGGNVSSKVGGERDPSPSTVAYKPAPELYKRGKASRPLKEGVDAGSGILQE